MKLIKDGIIVDINGEDTAAGYISSGWKMVDKKGSTPAEDRAETAGNVQGLTGASPARAGRKRKTE